MMNSGCSKRKGTHFALRKSWKCLGEERGQSLIELAVTIPFLALLLFGAVEIYRALYVSIEVSDAAMSAVQYGTLSPTAAVDSAGIQNAAAANAPGLTLSTTSTTSCACSDGSASTCQPTDCPGSTLETILKVQTQTTIEQTIQLPGLPKTYTLRGQAIQKVLQ